MVKKVTTFFVVRWKMAVRYPYFKKYW